MVFARLFAGAVRTQSIRRRAAWSLEPRAGSRTDALFSATCSPTRCAGTRLLPLPARHVPVPEQSGREFHGSFRRCCRPTKPGYVSSVDACGESLALIGFWLEWVVGPAGFSGISGMADSCGGARRGSCGSSFRSGLGGETRATQARRLRHSANWRMRLLAARTAVAASGDCPSTAPGRTARVGQFGIAGGTPTLLRGRTRRCDDRLLVGCGKRGGGRQRRHRIPPAAHRL